MESADKKLLTEVLKLALDYLDSAHIIKIINKQASEYNLSFVVETVTGGGVVAKSKLGSIYIHERYEVGDKLSVTAISSLSFRANFIALCHEKAKAGEGGWTGVGGGRKRR